MCRRRFILNKKESTLLISVVDNGGGFACGTIRGIYGKSLHLPLNFIVNLKVL